MITVGLTSPNNIMASSTFIYPLVVLINGAFSSGHINTKIWRSNIYYNNPENWNKGRLPCLTDRVIFNYLTAVPIELPPQNLIFRELVLPLSGEIIMQENGELTFSGKKYDPTCKGEDNEFLSGERLDWLDVNNWMPSGKAVPFIERIPCLHDTVVFPSSSFAVLLPAETVSVSSIIINDTILMGKSWEDYLSTPTGMMQFKERGGRIEARGNGPCEKKEGCQCGTQILQKDVCDQSSCYIQTQCFTPVKPIGHCCVICGAYLLYRIEEGFDFNQLEDMVKMGVVGEAVEWYVSRVPEDLLQIVLVDKGPYDTNSPQVASKLNKYLLNLPDIHIKLKGIYASGLEYRPMTLGTKATHLLGSLFVVLTILVGIAVYFYSGEKIDWRTVMEGGRRSGRFMFARFENLTGEVEITPEHGCEASDEHAIRSFDNPMYAAPGQVENEPLFVNPVYSEIKAKVEAEEEMYH